MVYAIQLMLGFRNAARRDATATNITNKFGTSSLYGTPAVRSTTMRGTNDPALYVESRFTAAADRDAMWTQLDTFLGTGVNGPVVGSAGWMHDCNVDESGNTCLVSATRTW
jgi:hypothetical protein